MKPNMKKIAIALVATNVVASSLITALPPVQTHAAEEKLVSNLKSSSGAMLDHVEYRATQITGRVPAGAGKRVVAEEYNRTNGVVRSTEVAMADASGNYVMKAPSTLTNGSEVRVTFDNGITAVQQISIGDMSTFKINPMKAGDTLITGSFAGHPNMPFIFTDPTLLGVARGVTDSEGNFSVPADVTEAMKNSYFRVNFNDEQYYMFYIFNPKKPASLPAVTFNVSGLNTAPEPGTTGKMSTGILPAAANQNVTYSSSDPSIIKVDANGNWTAVATGTANIIVASASAATNNVVLPVTVKDSAVGPAKTAADGLFINNDPAKGIKDSTNQAAIDAAKVLVDKVTDATQKADLTKEINLAQNNLNAKTIFHGFSVNANATAWFAKIDESRKAEYSYDILVNGEYVASWYANGSSPYARNSTDGIDRILTYGYTFKEGDVLTATVRLDGTLYEVGKLTVSFYNNAKTAADELFINNDPSKGIKDTTNQAAIDAAKASADKITDATKKAEINAEIQKAQDQLDVKTATASVNNLFSNASTNTILKDSTTQAMIDAASAKVNALPISADKTKLQGDVTTANTLFNQITQTTIGALTSDSTTVSGKGEANANIVIKNGTETIAIGKVASDGNYIFTIAKQPGNSTVTATVTKASNGKTSSASTVVKDDSIVQTTIGALTVESTMVTGKGEPNANIVITNGGTVLESGKVASDGTYLFFITKQAGGSTITATVTKPSNGKISSASTTIVDDAITATTISALTTDSTTVSGKGEPNGNIVIKNGTESIAIGKVASDGNYLFFITKQPAGSTITATVTKTSNGKTSSASTKITVNPVDVATASVNALFADAPTNSILKDTTTQAMIDAASAKVSDLSRDIPEKAELQADINKANTLFNQIAVTTIGTLTADSTTVTGKGEPNAPITIQNGGTTIATGKVGSDGTYSFIIGKQAGGSTIVATVTKTSNGKTSSASTTIPVVIDYSLKANNYKIGTTNLTGTYGKNIAKVRLFVNGTLIVQATTSNGNFTFANIASYITKPTDKVEVVGVDGSYVERARVAVTVTGDPVYDYSLTANDYTLGNTTLTGKYGKDVSKVRLWVNNVVVSQATTNADGTYSFDKVPSFIKLTTDKVEVVGVNAAYNEVARKTVVTKGSSILDTSLTPNAYAKDSANLTGTFGKDISKIRLWVNGAVVAQASTSGSNFTFTNIASFIKNKTDIVEVVGVDAQYKELNRKPVTLTGFDTLDNSLTAPADFTLNKDTAINGNMGTNVSKVRLSVNGVIVKQAATTGGTYSIAGANAYITSTSDVVKVIAVDAQYKEVNSKTVTVKADGTIYDYKLNVNPYTFGDATITGTLGKDVAAVRLWVNGAVSKTASLNNGNFTLSGLASITSPTDLVEIVAVNASYKEVARVTIQPK